MIHFSLFCFFVKPAQHSNDLLFVDCITGGGGGGGPLKYSEGKMSHIFICSPEEIAT